MNGANKSEAPIDPEQFHSACERLGAQCVILAVSGGCDSMALMRLAAPLHASGAVDIAVATVDHGLRHESRSEAEFVAREAKALGLPHSILSWRGEKPPSGVQAAARGARYRLLAAHCIESSFSALMTAHTADDQAETVFMRLARGSGPKGLSGMAEESLVAAAALAPVRLLRPLLGVRRAALRAYLDAAGTTFVDDPSNENLHFERVRVRRQIARMEQDGVQTTDALLQTANASRVVSDCLEAADNQCFFAAGGAFDAWGSASLDNALLTPDNASLTARLIHAVSGADYPPNNARAAKSLTLSLSGKSSTLGGVVAALEKDRLVFFREPSAVLGRAGVDALLPLHIRPGERLVWDNRFIVGNPFAVSAMVVALGADAATLVPAGTAPECVSASPGLWIDGQLVALPGEGGDFEPLAEERFLRRVGRFH